VKRVSVTLFVLVLAATGCDPGVAQDAPRSGFDCLADAPYPCALPGGLGLDPDVLQAFTDDLYAWINSGGLVGAELLVVKDRQIAWHVAMGWSDREGERPLRRNSIYRMRSMTKPFVGTAVLILAEEGLLDLDDRVADHLPSFDNERSGEITIRQLLTHGAGFEQTAFSSAYWAEPTLREAVRSVGKEGPPNPPGERYRYADRSSATLGAIVAELTGRPVEEFIRSRILEPIGLHDTHAHFAPDSAWAGRMNSTYSLQGGRLSRYWDNTQVQQTPWFRASGGLYSTVFDYARWLEVWMDHGALKEGHLLTDETIVEALSPGFTEGYGLHWELFSGSPEEGGLPAFGHGGSDGTFAIAYPELDAMILFFTQSRGAVEPWREALGRLPILVGRDTRLR
jgi:CubicO group peptidase (beta-lactamase class C family)